MKTSEQINDIAAAISKLQSDMQGADKDGKNAHFKSDYSTLENVWQSIRPHLGKHGICVVQSLQTKETCVSVTTFVAHSSGQWIEFSPLDVPFAKKDAHGVGSACTYGKRYSLCAALGIVASTEKDDDANEAVGLSQISLESHPAELFPEAFISDEEAINIENMLAGMEEQYRKDLIGYFQNVTRNPSMTTFYSLPRKHLNACMKSIQRRMEKKDQQ